jgi:hypothetical protein
MSEFEIKTLGKKHFIERAHTQSENKKVQMLTLVEIMR